MSPFHLLALSLAVFVSAQSLQDSFGQSGIEVVFLIRQDMQMRVHLPAAVAYPTSIDQISQIVKLGAAANFSVVARSGGYIAAGTGGEDNAIVIDLSKNKQISVDDASGTASDSDRKSSGRLSPRLCLTKGAAMPHGSCAYVGIGGHGAFGGYGFQSRILRLSSSPMAPSQPSRPPLTRSFSGPVRGSAPSFGIVYNATYKTFEAPTNNTIYQLVFCSTELMFPLPLVDELNIFRGSSKGKIGVSLFSAFWGPTEDFDALIQKFTSQVPSSTEVTSPEKKTTGTWMDALKVIMGDLSTTNPDGTDTFYAKSLLTPQGSPMTDEAINSYVDYLANEGFDSQTSWFNQIEFYGGPTSAINQVDVDSTAFVRRDLLFNFQLYASSSNNKPPYPDAGFTFVDGMLNSIVNKESQDWNYS
ncbi:hypothetical protein DL96DRAFT_1708964 [Flagelloscypha sp. PMI_526]|nr:hypothetical protein DL96DRAFT_1708964 [Flagelloscypha sp. PMI_526]